MSNAQSIQGRETDEQGGQVKLHVGILKGDKSRVREKSLSRQDEQHMQTLDNMTL